jgi:cytochrome c-type biogenesis protein CcmH/NrfG
VRPVFKLSLCLIAWGICLAGTAWPATQQDLDRARALYDRTLYGQALQIVVAVQPKTASTYGFLGQCLYMLEEYKKASEAFEKAIQAEPSNSVYWDWLGKAYGRRAETSSFLTAPHYASEAREYFEKAFALDPGNVDAVDDLFDYYLEAPGFLGGGVDKAAQIAERVHAASPAKYQSMQARIAEKQKQIPSAEQHLRQAIQAAPAEVGRVIDLARFLARQGRPSESDAAFERARQINPNSAELKFQRARVYVDANRKLDEARKLLQEYLASPLTPDDPPRNEAQKLLKKITKS